jgi:hypothetical protein
MKHFLVILIVTLNSIIAFAQEVSFTASAKNVVAVGEQFRLSYQVNKQGKNFNVNAMPGFRVLSGPNVSNSSSISVVNGQVTKNITQSFNYVLMAEKEGKFTIPAASINVNGKNYKSNTLNIEVVKKGASSQQSANGNTIDPKNLYLQISAPKRSVYLGEPVLVTLKIYSRVDLADLQNAEFPEYKGFYSQEIKTPDNITLQRENIKGTIYNTAILNKVLLYPQKTGEIVIERAKIDAIVQQKVQQRNRRRSVFDDFFGGGYKNYRVPLKSNQLKIKVNALPANNPNEFFGAVGQFKVKAEVDNTELKANDALTYKLTVSGSGNIKLLEDPKIEFPHDFDVWEPTVSNKIKNSETGSKGKKIYEYVIQPRHPGNFTIPKFQLAYFDPKAKTYKTIETESFDINVLKGDQQATVVNQVGLTKEEVELIGQDIRYIKTGHLNLSVPATPLLSNWLYWLNYMIGGLIFVLIFILRRKQIKQASDSVLMKNKKAKKEAIKRLKVANTHLKDNASESFYEEIIKGLQGYLSDKLSIPFADLNLEIALSELQKRDISEDKINQLKDIIQDCEIARYAPSQATKKMDDIYNISLELISAFESGIKADLKNNKN